MSESLPTKESREIETPKEYMRNLGLNPHQLFGQEVLDVGAGRGVFIRFAKEQGAKEAIGIDNGTLPDAEDMARIAETGTVIVNADAASMPFPDNSFDLVVSHAAIPNIASDTFVPRDPDTEWDFEKEDREMQDRRIVALREMIRVTKVGGEIRCAPIISATGELAPHQGKKIAEAIQALDTKNIEIDFAPMNAEHWRLVIRKIA